MTERLTYLRNLQKRRDEVLSLIGEQGKLTPEIEAAVAEAKTLTEIEDIYRPFRPKRKTRASIAREKGLEPLAALLLEQRKVYNPSIEESAAAYIDEEKVWHPPRKRWPEPRTFWRRIFPTMLPTVGRSAR